MRKKTRICHVASGDLWAGAEVQVFNILDGLKKRGNFELYAVIMNEGKLHDELSRIGINVLLVNEKKMSFLRQILMVRSFIRKNKIEMVHSHRYKENILSVMVKLSLPSKLKLLKTQHGSFNIVSTRRLKFYRAIEVVFTKYFFGKVIAVSEDIRKEFATFLPASKLVTVHNSINLDNYTKSDEGNNKGRKKYTIGIVGRLVEIKNIPEFVNIAVGLHKKGVALDAYIVGDGPEAFYLKSCVENCGVENLIVFTGNLDDMSSFYNNLDMLFITSFHEGVPTVLLEAMYFGKIVIAHRVGGIPEVVKHGVNGLLYDDVGQAVDIAFRVIEKPKEYINIKRVAAVDAVKKYTNLIQAGKYEEEYILRKDSFFIKS